ncbi:cysteine-rich RECEPTOR-like kinase [Rhynchospora pubera]|uniref:Cysteine-rich RECEPTOR-like kinase n=1 Tax=Rhynchospora pubera TaxID=906938 RepID=A0AAV8DIZ7_9POAL|nr:cysteine-rich RECEPTOR-like kinase [Rhynchospora pubera]
MSRLAIAEFFFIILFSKFGLILSYDDDFRPFFTYCGTNNTNIDLDSSFSKLFSDLSSKADSSNDGSATTSVNAGTPYQLNGLIMCYIDSSQDHCSQCLNFSIINASKICPGSSTATFTYGWCFLRYSPNNFIATVTFDEYPNIYRNDIKSNSTTLIETVYELMYSLRLEATNSSNFYSYGNRTDPGMNRLVYGLVQCSKDLDAISNCGLCLNYAVGNLSDFMPNEYLSIGTRLSFMSCYIRYELYPLPLLTFKSPAPAPSPAPIPGPPTRIPGAPVPIPGLPSSILSPPSIAGSSGSTTKHIVIAAISAFGALLFLSVSAVCFWRMLRTRQISTKRENGEQSGSLSRSRVKEDASLECSISGNCHVFLLSELKSATDNFSEDNRLGGGGFGSVYKGVLHDGKEIAVKRLDGGSKQGFLEFKTEVELLAKLKHRNLVKLLGYCTEKNEKLLCYEYLPSKSLDRILFATDKIKREKLSWHTRYKIIEGISSGLQYLHIESGYKIVHRDLKPENILMDEDMNPKISDFGLARLYQDHQTQMATSIIAGTYGYMAPEYAMHGMYSEKSDVYSFGILLMEIVTGRKNSSFCNNLIVYSLVSYVAQRWAQGEVEVLKDPVLEDACMSQLSRCIQIGLLCVQQNPINRPNMDAINLMLRNDSIDIPALPRIYMSRPDLLVYQYSISTTTTNSSLTTGDHSSSTEAGEAKSTDKTTAMLDHW